jgi:plastocyanin
MLVAVAVAVLGLASVSSAAAKPTLAQKTVKVTVTMTEFKFKLSKHTFKAGDTVIFKVVNKGDELHDFMLSSLNKKTKYIKSGKSAILKVTFKKKGKYPYLCTVGEHAQRGMQGTITVK